MSLLPLLACTLVPERDLEWPGAPEDTGLATLSPSDASAELRGEASGDMLGAPVLGPGDLDGDGIGDVIVGASGHDPHADGQGAVFLLRGPWRAGAGVVEAASHGVRFVGEAAGDGYGAAVAVGDLDEDGVADLAVGAPLANAGAVDGGEIYVYRGLLPTNGDVPPSGGTARANGTSAVGEHFGGDLAAAPGLLAAGAIHCENADGDESAGRVYLYDNIALTSPRAYWEGEEAQDYAGRGLALADVDGDDLVDLVVGATGHDGAAVEAGMVYIWAGVSAAEGVLSLADADARYSGAHTWDGAGTSIAAGCDVTGDGAADLLVGAFQSGVGPGLVHVVEGGAGVGGALGLGAARATLAGPEGGDYAAATACGQDLDGDAVDDLVIGAFGRDWGGDDTGSAWFVGGGADLVGTVEVGEAAAVRVDGAPGDRLGVAVALADDLDGDGAPDLLVGADQVEAGGPGTAYVFTGLWSWR